VTIDRIVAEMAKIGFSDIRRALDWGMKQTEDGPVPYPNLAFTPKKGVSTPRQSGST
jgi:hypothetical protein